MILYSARTILDSILLAKFDEAFNVEATYLVGPNGCDCPAKKPCKHQAIAKEFATKGRLNADWFYCWFDGTWHQPLAAPAGSLGTVTEPATNSPPSLRMLRR